MNTSLSYGEIYRLQHALLLNELFIIWNYGYAFWTSSILNFLSLGNFHYLDNRNLNI